MASGSCPVTCPKSGCEALASSLCPGRGAWLLVMAVGDSPVTKEPLSRLSPLWLLLEDFPGTRKSHVAPQPLWQAGDILVHLFRMVLVGEPRVEPTSGTPAHKPEVGAGQEAGPQGSVQTGCKGHSHFLSGSLQKARRTKGA